VSPLALKAAVVPRAGDLPPVHASKSYFLLGQNAHGLWVVHESTGRRGGLFRSRQAAMRFVRLESRDEHFAVLHVPDLEFDYAAEHL
jgi:hypothetical protein